MPGFYSPLVNPAGWTFSHELMDIPAGMRYGGYRIRAMRCNIATAVNVLAPFRSVIKKYSVDSEHVLELQMTPFIDSDLVHALSGGVPTCYVSFPNDSGFATLENDAFLDGNDVLRSTDSVAIGLVFQDRVVRDPHYWSELFFNTLTDAGVSTLDWAAFNTAVDNAFGGNDSPVLLLEGNGALMENASVDVVYNLPGGPQTHQLVMIPTDQGDLQQTVSRMGLPIANLWATDSSFTLRPTVAAALRPEWQFARLEDAISGDGEIAVTPDLRHIQMIHLHEWLAPQFVPTTTLSRFSRGNKLTSFVNGPEFFDDLFRELPSANSSGNGFHHVGYLIVHNHELTKLKDDDPAELALKLEDAMTRISDGNGKICLLPAQFIHLTPGSTLDDYSVAIMLILFLSLSAVIILHTQSKDVLGIDFAKIDGAGLFIVFILLFSSFFLPLLPEIVIDDDGLVFFEFNKAVRDFTEGLANGRAIIAPYPASVDDNPDFQTNWLIDMGLDFSTQFGIYHQKFSILKNTGGHIAYCGGIDLNPNRLDDEHHMAKVPYHDTHCRIEGPAVTDVAQTFDERWQHEAGSGTDLAFAVPVPDDLVIPDGNQIIQVGRTYFASSSATRQLPFAQTGDRTILDSVLNGIEMAREFIYIEDQYLSPPEEFKTALINKVLTRAIKKLVIAVPDDGEQPFGDIEKTAFIQDLKDAETTLLPGETVAPSIVHVGYPRRNYHLPDNKVRASSGKCILEEDLPKNAASLIDEEITLGRGTRLPGVPFYMAIEGEILYAYKLKETKPNAAAAEDPITARPTTRVYNILRGDDLPDMATKRIEHKKGAAVSILQYAPIYVHSKMMIVDDLFLSLGSANLNKRGFYHDAEANIFCIPEGLRNGDDNPVRDLRLRLWADMLNLPRDMAAGLLVDPIAAAELFARPLQHGNRLVDLKDRPPMMLFGPIAGTGKLEMILTSLAALTISVDLTYEKFYKTLVDPASELQP